MPLKHSQEHIIVASKEGYTTAQVHIDNRLSSLGILDCAGTCLFLLPGISLLTGSVFELTPSSVYLALDPKQESAK